MLEFDLPENHDVKNSQSPDWVKPLGAAVLVGYGLYKYLTSGSNAPKSDHIVEKPNQGQPKSRAWMSLDY